MLCPQCGKPLREKSGVSKKTGKPYRFLGCSGYPNCEYTQFLKPEPKQGLKKVIPTIIEKEEMIKYLGILRGDIQGIKKELEGIKQQITNIETNLIGKLVENPNEEK